MGLWSRVKSVVTKKKSTPAPTPTKRDAPLSPGQQGPVRPQPVIQGPTRPSDNVKVFRDTGVSTGSSGSSGTSSSPVTVGNVTFGNGQVTSTDPITQKTTTISKPIASTSATQVQKQSGTVSADLFDPKKSYKQSLGTSALTSFAILGSNIKSAVTTQSLGGWKSPFTPFRYSGQLEGERVVYNEPQFGTTTQAYKPVTGFDIQQRETEKFIISNPDLLKYAGTSPRGGYTDLGIDTSKEVSSKYQKLVDSGKLDFETATKEAQKELDTTYSEKAGRLSNLYGSTYKPELYERTGVKIERYAPEVIKAGALVGASFTPLAPLTAGYIAGMGTTNIIKGSLPGAVNPQTGLSLTGGERAKLIGTGTLQAGLGVASYSSQLRGIEKGILREELKELSGQPLNFKQINVQGTPTKSLISLEGTRTSGGLTENVQLVGRLTRKGDSLIFTQKGTGFSTVSGEFGWNYYMTPQGTKIISSKAFTSKDIGFAIGSETSSKSLAMNVYTPQVESSLIYKGGTSPVNVMDRFSRGFKLSKDPSLISFQGGVSEKIGDDLYASVGKPFKGITYSTEGSTPFKIDFGDVSSRGITKIIRLPSSDSTGTGITIFKGGGTKTPFSTTFGTTAQQTQTGTQAFVGGMQSSLSQVSNTPASLTSSTRTVATTFNLPKVRETQITTQTPRTSVSLTPKTTTKISSIVASIPTSRTSTSLFQPTKQKFSSIVIPRVEQLPKLTQKPLQKLTPGLTGFNPPVSPPTFGTPSLNPPFGFFKPKLGTGSFGGLGNIKASRKYREATSFGVARLKGFKVGELSTQRFTGLEARDVTKRKKKSKNETPFSGLFKFKR